MTVTFEFYQQLTWIDERILLNLSAEESKLGGVPLNSNQLHHIWTPGLWIQSLFDFKLRSVFEPSIGLFIHEKTRCELNGCNNTSDTNHGDVINNNKAVTVLMKKRKRHHKMLTVTNVFETVSLYHAQK